MQNVAIALLCGALYCPVTDYDPSRDALRDIHEAVAWAAVQHKRVLLEVGGKWCERCRVLDRIFREMPGLAALREREFITVKVNVSPENENREALHKLPAVYSYPHMFVLDSAGRLVRSQDLDALFASPAMFRDFLEFCRSAPAVGPAYGKDPPRADVN
jgi:hypothetical protein